MIGNENLLVNVLDNVLTNAINYSPRGAVITAGVHGSLLSVVNSGASIPEEALA